MGFLDDLGNITKKLIQVATDPTDDSLKALGKEVAESLGIEVAAKPKLAVVPATGTDGAPAAAPPAPATEPAPAPAPESPTNIRSLRPATP